MTSIFLLFQALSETLKVIIINILINILLFLVKTWNGEKSFVDREAEQDKINGVKRSFDDEYNEDFDRGVVSIF